MNEDIPSNNDDGSYQAGTIASASADEERAYSHAARVARVLDYQANALSQEDALTANLGALNAGLMGIALGLEEIIQEAMGRGPQTIDRLQRMLPAIDTHLRVTRQVDRFAQLAVRAAEARKPKASSHAPGTLCVEASPATEIDEAKIS